MATPAHAPPTPPRAQRCTRPGCGRTAQHRHHAVGRSWQRSHLGHVTDWLIIDGKMVLALVDLCTECHDALESRPGGTRARLRWTNFAWAWYWRATEIVEGGIYWIDPQTGPWQFIGWLDGAYVHDAAA